MHKSKALLSSVFNATNLNALAGVVLSQGMGHPVLGASIFGGALALGTYNKYTSLTRPENQYHRNALERLIRHPSITAVVLMCGASINCVDATYDSITGTREELLDNSTRAAAWFFGVMGDNVLRRLDKVNFTQLTNQPKKALSTLKTSFMAATANPTIFYNLASIAFTINMLEGTPLSSSIGVYGLGLIAGFGSGIIYSMVRTQQAMMGKIPVEQINDGVLNGLAIASLLGQTVFATITNNPYAAAAHLIFAMSIGTALFETRAALKKEGLTPSSP